MVDCLLLGVAGSPIWCCFGDIFSFRSVFTHLRIRVLGAALGWAEEHKVLGSTPDADITGKVVGVVP